MGAIIPCLVDWDKKSAFHDGERFEIVSLFRLVQFSKLDQSYFLIKFGEMHHGVLSVNKDPQVVGSFF